MSWSVSTDGGIGALEAFTLEDPARLVVDLPGIAAASSATGLPVDSELGDGGAHGERTQARCAW